MRNGRKVLVYVDPRALTDAAEYAGLLATLRRHRRALRPRDARDRRVEAVPLDGKLYLRFSWSEGC